MTRHSDRHVTILIPHLRPYGAERVALDVADALSSASHVTIMTFAGSAEENARMVPDGVSHVHISRHRRGLASVPELVRGTRSHIRSTPFGPVLSFMHLAGVLAYFGTLGTGRPFIATEHNLPSQTMETAHRYPGVMRLLTRIAYKRARSTVCVTSAVRSDVTEYFGLKDDKVVVIYNPIDAQRIQHAALRPARSAVEGDDLGLGRTLARGDATKLIVMVGAFKRAKNHALLLSAVARLQHPARLLLLGDGPLMEEMQTLAKDLGIDDRVVFAGWTDSPHPFVRMADVVVVPSRYEGFGLVAAEAAVLERPLVASDAPGLVEVARHLDAEVFASQDVEGLVNALDQQLSAPRVPSREWIATELHPTRVAERYAEILWGPA